MMITNEPGIYLPEEGFGIRIEDDLLVTAAGCEVMTREIPKSIADIEAAMRS
jgi:Xaa-Pro aminopeptidase